MRLATSSLRKQWWLIPMLALAWGATRWIGTLGGAARVCDLPGYPLAVRHGRLVVARNSPRRSPALVVQSARGGQERIFEVPRGHRPRGAQVTETHLVYLTSSERLNRDAPAIPGVSGGSGGAPRSVEYALYRFPWSGGREVKHFEGAPGAILTREGCYWWGASQGRVRPLHFMPLLEGESREIGGGEGMLLRSGSEGGAVVLMPGGPRSGEVRQSIQVRGQMSQLAMIDDISGIPTAVHLAGRRYWIERSVQSQPGGEPRPDRIMSARRDGSDRKTVLEAQNRTVEFGQLMGQGENLYVALAEPLAGRTDNGKSIRVVSLCRLRPEDPTAEPQRLCAIPGQGATFYLDGEDAYFAVPEDRENWWDWSARGLIPRRVVAWYHFRLPPG